jgi:CHAD domain-containing protein
MPRFNKWLSDIDPSASVAKIGRRAIRTRLAAVVHFLRATRRQSHRAEAIHQLRIWTRRSAAAIRHFEPLVPPKRGRKMKRRLRRIRAAAGQERDCDVMLERLRTDPDRPSKSVIQALKQQRRRAAKRFNTLRKRMIRRDRLPHQIDDFLDSLAWPKRHSSREAPSFAAWCRTQLVSLSEPFFTLADGPLRQDAKLHELRIAGKRLRYALELAPAALPAKPHQRLYAALSELQERLGTVCDHVSALARLKAWRAAAKSPADRRAWQTHIRRQKEQLTAERKAFLRWWSGERRRRLHVAARGLTAEK